VAASDWLDRIANSTNLENICRFWLRTLFVSDQLVPGASGRIQVFARLINPRLSLIRPAAITELVQHQSMVMSPVQPSTIGVVTAATAAGAMVTATQVSGVMETLVNSGRGISTLAQKAYQLFQSSKAKQVSNSFVKAEKDKGERVFNAPTPFSPFTFMPSDDGTYLGNNEVFHVDPKRFDDDPDDHSIRALCQIPSFLGNFSLTANTSKWFPGAPFNWHGGAPYTNIYNVDNGWANFFCSFFRYYRGSTKYYIVFMGNSLINHKIQISISAIAPATDTSAAPTTGTTYVSQHNITGTQVVEVVLPYAHGSPVAFTPNQLDSAYSPQVVPLNLCVTSILSTSMTAVPLVTLNFLVFRCCGEDFQFYEPRSPLSKTYVPLMVTHQAQMFGQLKPVLVKFADTPYVPQPYRKLDTLEEMMSVYTSRAGASATSTVLRPFNVTTAQDFSDLSWYDLIGSLFLYVRGSVRLKRSFERPTVTQGNTVSAEIQSNPYVLGTTPTNTLYPANSYMAQNLSVNSILAYEAPILVNGYALILNTVDYSGSHALAAYDVHEDGGVTSSLYIASGSSFQAFKILFPPLYSTFPNYL